eukprot:8907997-Pyramimonas_sp.AAC.1
MFHSFFPPWTEVHQPDPARREIASGEICHVSRPDRLYLASPTAVLSDLSITCSSIGKATTAQNVSDHVPVLATFRKCQPSENPSIPPWIGMHPRFHVELEAFLCEMDRTAQINDQVAVVK